MYSFISNSKTEAKVVLMVVLVLAVCELGIRAIEKRLSVDLRTPAISRKLAEGEGQRVLVLGNSLVRDNVNTDVLEEELRAQGVGPIHIERVYLLNTIINDWYYAFKHHFVDTGRTPDVLVLCFSHGHLEDSTLQRSVVARYYSGARDLPEIFSEDVKSFDGRVEFLLSAWSASFTYRTNVQRRILDSMVPHYRESVVRINNTLRDETIKHTVYPEPTYVRFGKLLRLAASKGVRVIVVAVPLQSYYPLNPGVRSTSEAAGVILIDTRTVEGLSKDSFIDGMHLNPDGATLYSRFLAHRLAGYLKAQLQTRPSDRVLLGLPGN
jgi:hypothetical protein